MRDEMKLAKRRFEIAAGAALALCGVSTAAHAVNVTNLSTAITNSLGSGSVYSATPLGINSSDQVVGFYTTNSSSATQVPFVYTPGSTAVTIPVAPSSFDKAYGINDSGTLVGSYNVSGSTGAFYYNASSGASSVSPILPVASNGSTSYTGANITAYAINNNGYVTGSSSVAPNYNASNPSSNRTFIFNVSGGVATDVSSGYSGTAVGYSGANGTFGYAINTNGIIANYGPTSTGSTTKQPFTLTPNGDGTYSGKSLASAITAADANYSAGTNNGFEGIDSLNNVVGDYTDGSGTSYGFFYNGSNATVINDTLYTGGSGVYINAISDVGAAKTPEFVGQATVGTTGITKDAFLDVGGTMYDLNTIDPVAGYTLIDAYAINSSGDIVATGETSASGPVQAFLLTCVSVPEPTSLGLLGIGSIALLGRRRERRVS